MINFFKRGNLEETPDIWFETNGAFIAGKVNDSISRRVLFFVRKSSSFWYFHSDHEFFWTHEKKKWRNHIYAGFMLDLCCLMSWVFIHRLRLQNKIFRCSYFHFRFSLRKVLLSFWIHTGLLHVLIITQRFCQRWTLLQSF